MNTGQPTLVKQMYIYICTACFTPYINYCSINSIKFHRVPIQSPHMHDTATLSLLLLLVLNHKCTGYACKICVPSGVIRELVGIYTESHMMDLLMYTYFFFGKNTLAIKL